MSENNLFQFAQVITELPLHTASQQHTDTPMSNYTQRYIHIRKVKKKKNKVLHILI